MIVKGELIVGEIGMGRGLISLVPVDTGIVPTLKSHANAGTIPIPESRVDIGTVHVHASIPIKVQTPQRVAPCAEPLGRHSRTTLNGSQCRADSRGHHLTPMTGKRIRVSTSVIISK